MSLSTPLWLLGLVVAFGLPVTGLVRPTPAADELDWPAVRRGLARSWAALALVVVIVAVAGEPSDLGLRVPSAVVLVDGILYGLVAFLAAMLFVGLAYRYVAGGLSADAPSLAIFEQSLSRRLAAAVTAATVEVVLFYGYVVEALLALGGTRWLAGAAAATGLLLVRARWGVGQAVQWLPGAAVLAVLTVATGTVVPALVARLVYDVIVFVSGDAGDYDESPVAGEQ